MKRSSVVPEQPQTSAGAIDMDLIAQRILKLAEISMLDHLDALARSQAIELTEMQGHNGRRMHPGH